ncbi:MAG: hypothetical protein ABIJ09_06740 [Pseudomonadota bacterium]
MSVTVCTLAACFELLIPEAAQITCSADNPSCPEGLQCCENRICRRQCACDDGAEPCGLNGAVDCQGQRICADHCWLDCPSCKDRCTSGQFRPCQADDFEEVWFCSVDDVCVIKHGVAGTTPTATCHRPPPQCTAPADQVCACLQAPFSISPPCSPFEYCTDERRPCVACREESPRTTDASIPDRGSQLDGGQSHLDVSEISLDSGTGPEPDATSALDGGGSTDAGGGIDAYTAAWPLDISATAPTCYQVSGAGPTCCDVASGSSFFDDVASSYACPGSAVFASQCQAFDESCHLPASQCSSTDTCRWAYCNQGQIRCSADGPLAPCGSEGWECPAGSIPWSLCTFECIP